MDVRRLIDCAQALVARDRGLLAMDESTGTCNKRFAKLGAEPWTMSPDQFDRYIKDDIAANAKLVKEAGISPQ